MPIINELNAARHFMYGLLEIDVTAARAYIAEQRARTGELLSFTGYLAFCLAQAVGENKAVQSYRKGRRQLVVYDDVDVGLMVERKQGDQSVLRGYVVRAANRKSWRAIHAEIRAAQAAPAPAQGEMPRWLRTLLLLPWPLSVGVKALVQTVFNRNPERFTSMVGTVGITAVGMFGKGMGGWGVVPIIHGLGLIVGSTVWRPRIIDGRSEPREILNLTIAIDHDVIDGAPAARFARRLVELLESGYGLD